jgi:hypothetical protein
MGDTRRWVWLVGGALLLGAVGSFVWAALRYDELVRDVVWPVVAQRPLDDRQQQKLASCERVDWTTWLRVLEQDVVLPCGELWGREQLAGRLESRGRQRYLQERLGAKQGPVRSRWRAAVALEAAGVSPVVPSSFLLAELPDELAVTLDDPSWAAHLDARSAGRVASLRVAAGDALDDHLAAVGAAAQAGGLAGELARDAARAFLGLDDAAFHDALERPPHTLPEPWAEAAHEAVTCTSDCGEAWLAFAERVQTDPDGLGQPDEVPSRPALADLGRLAVLRPPSDDVATIAWLLDDDARWVRSGVVPGDRLRRLHGPPGDDERLLTQLYGRSPRPEVAALWLVEVGARAGIEVTLWRGARTLVARVGEEEHRLCGAGAADTAVTERAVAAWALAAAGVGEGRVARLGGWEAPVPDSVGGGIGASLWSADRAAASSPCSER